MSSGTRYNGPEYAALKREYDGGGRLADLYDKCVRAERERQSGSSGKER